MEYRMLGGTGIQVPVLSLGSWQTFEQVDEASGLAVLAAAIDAGITFLDDARYDDRTGVAPLATGYSEVLFGQLLRKGGWPRERLVIANKLWLEFYPEQSMAAELDGSLSRMGLDYLDLLYCDAPAETLSTQRLLEEIHELLHAGKIRAWGVLNWPARRIREAHELASRHGYLPPAAAQLPYSLLHRETVESESMRAACADAGTSIVASACLAGGLLSGKYDGGAAPQGARLDAERLAALQERGALARTRLLSEEARALGCAPAALALAFVLRNEQVCSVLFGAKRPGQVSENAGCLEVLHRLDDAAFARIAELFAAPAAAAVG